MAKKNPSEQTSASPASPAKRRAAPRKSAGVASSASTNLPGSAGPEPIATAADMSLTSPGRDNGYQPTHEEIAEAAYFRHLNRGGSGGDDFNDWVEAERELRERRSR